MKVIFGHFHFSYHFNTAYDSIIDMPTCFSSPVRHSPQNSPFIHDQGSWVILKFGELKYPWAMSAGCSCWISSWRIQEMFPGSKRSSGSFGTSKRPGQHDPSPLGIGIVDGRCLVVYWFEGPVTGGMYLEMLKTVMWPSVRVQAARRGYWFQQDGVPVHVTIEVMDFLRSKFGGRSCYPGEPSTIGHYSQDLPCLDFSFWPQASPEVAEWMRETLDEWRPSSKASPAGWTATNWGAWRGTPGTGPSSAARRGWTLRALPVDEPSVTANFRLCCVKCPAFIILAVCFLCVKIYIICLPRGLTLCHSLLITLYIMSGKLGINLCTIVFSQAASNDI